MNLSNSYERYDDENNEMSYSDKQIEEILERIKQEKKDK